MPYRPRKSSSHEPLTHLLRAQAAQLNGDASTARRIFEAMLASPDTAQLGLRGLFLEAKREGETEAARPICRTCPEAQSQKPRLARRGPVRFDVQGPGLAGRARHPRWLPSVRI